MRTEPVIFGQTIKIQQRQPDRLSLYGKAKESRRTKEFQRMKKKSKAERILGIDKARDLIKVTAVILRDHSHLSYHDASLALAYCWKHTETEEQAERRDEEARS